MRIGFARGGEAEGDGHYFGFAEEESGVCWFAVLWRQKGGGDGD